MVVAVACMLMMQVPVHQVISMVPMGHLGMSAVWSMDVITLVSVAQMAICATSWILLSNLNNMFVDVTPVNMMEMAIMEVIHMGTMLNTGMAAGFIMVVGMVLVLIGAGIHGAPH